MTTQTAHKAARLEAPDSLDDFPTPPWATRALVVHVLHKILAPEAVARLEAKRVWEPAAGRGYMTRALAETFGPVFSSDIQDLGWPGLQLVMNFLDPAPDFFRAEGPGEHITRNLDWIITNPPYGGADDRWLGFARRCIEHKPASGFALFGPVRYISGIGRFNSLFSRWPVTVFAPFAERVPIVKGRLDPMAGTLTDYAWFVWLTGWKPQPMQIIPPCRTHLEKPGDYIDREQLEEDAEQ